MATAVRASPQLQFTSPMALSHRHAVTGDSNNADWDAAWHGLHPHLQW